VLQSGTEPGAVQALTTNDVTPFVLILLAIPALAWAQEDEARSYVVGGREAWEVAHRQGFEFFPVIPDDRYLLSGARDGRDTTLKSCPNPRDPCEAEARVEGGQMIVLAPGCDGCARIHAFEMFAGRRLAAGWRLAHVELARDARWTREPRYDTDDASFAVTVEARGTTAGAASITRITLLGPPDADWRQAFAEES
jgi:hypothetical protein